MFFDRFSLRSSRQKPTVYLICVAGSPNFGDDFVLSAWLRQLKEMHPDANVWVDCPCPAIAIHLLGEAFPAVRFTDFVWRLSWTLCNRDASGCVSDGTEFWTTGRESWSHFEFASRPLLNADIVHIAGTGFLNEIWSRNLSIPAIVAAAPLKSRTALRAITGAGLLPCSSTTLDALKPVFSLFDFVDLRDSSSFDALTSLTPLTQNNRAKYSMTGDDSFLAEMQPSARSEPCLSFCLQGDFWEESHTEAIVETVVAAAKTLELEPPHYRLYELYPPIDRRFFSKLRSHFPSLQIKPFADIWFNGLDITPHDFIITSRFHMHLLGARSGAQGLWLNPQSGYYDIKHHSVLSSGSRWAELLVDPTQHPTHGRKADPLAFRSIRLRKLALAQEIYLAALPPRISPT